MPVFGEPETVRLQLTTTIIAQKCCASDYLRLTLQLRFTNLGTQPLILYRASTVIYRQMVSSDPKAAAEKRYEEDVSPMVNPLGMPRVAAAETDPSDLIFVTLNPSESFDTETRAHLAFIHDGTNNARESLRSGEHFLQVQVRTWYDSRQVAETLRDLWRKHGFLWTDSITSTPLPFGIKKKRPIVKC